MRPETTEELEELRRLCSLAANAHEQGDRIQFASALAEYSTRGMNLAGECRDAVPNVPAG
jgi:hypothetical protein